MFFSKWAQKICFSKILLILGFFFQDLLDRYAFRRKQLKKGVRASICSLCNQGSFTELNLRLHLKKEHGYKPCKYCREIFDTDLSLRDHFCPLQNITCEQCPKFFRSAAGWMLHHRKVHGGMRPVCDICGDQLSDVNGLRRHMTACHPSVQGDLAVPPCHICGKQLKNKYSLYQHERQYHNKKFRPDPCKFCKRDFSTRSSLRRHIATVHRRQVNTIADKNANEEDEDMEDGDKEREENYV